LEKYRNLTVLSPTDDVLWNRLKQGDESAFSGLFERYHASLVNYGKTLTATSERVPDCVQDVFVDIWLYRCALNEVTSVKAYLLSSTRKRIARLHARDHIFRQTSSIEEVDFLLDFTIEDQLIADEETATKAAQLNHLINKLPARQKEVLYLRYYQGLSVKQIAEMLTINYQSVVNLLHRAIQYLRHEWSGELTLLFLVISTEL